MFCKLISNQKYKQKGMKTDAEILVQPSNGRTCMGLNMQEERHRKLL